MLPSLLCNYQPHLPAGRQRSDTTVAIVVVAAHQKIVIIVKSIFTMVANLSKS